MNRAAIVVGASSGIGAALARQYALEEGRPVAILARRGKLLSEIAATISAGGGRALVLEHDVRDVAEVEGLFRRCEAELGPAEIFVYAAGVLPRVETVESFQATIEIGLVGAAAWLQTAAKAFQARGLGRICGISSIAGDRGRQAYPAYHAAKAGLSTLLESLHYRLHRHGISVTTIKPGFIDTAMTRGMKGLFWLIGAERAATIIRRKIAAGVRVAYVPARWRLVALVLRLAPAFVMRRAKV